MTVFSFFRPHAVCSWIIKIKWKPMSSSFPKELSFFPFLNIYYSSSTKQKCFLFDHVINSENNRSSITKLIDSCSPGWAHRRTQQIFKVAEKKCQQRSSIRQFDTALPLPLSLTNSRAAHYKLPCDTLWMTLDWKSRLKSGRGEEA